MSINIKQTTRQVEVAPREEVVESYIDTNGVEHDTLFAALKANHDIVDTSLSGYFRNNWDIQENYEQQVSFTEFYHNEQKYYAFVCSSEDDAELAMILIGEYLGLDLMWSVPSKGKGSYMHIGDYGRDCLKDAFCDIINYVHDAGSVAYYFGLDDRGDSPSFYYGLLSEIEKEMRDEVTDLQAELKKVSSLSTRAHVKSYSKHEEENDGWVEYAFKWNPGTSPEEVQESFYAISKVGGLQHTIHWTSMILGQAVERMEPEYVEIYGYYGPGRECDRVSYGEYNPGDLIKIGHKNGRVVIQKWRDGEIREEYAPLGRV